MKDFQILVSVLLLQASSSLAFLSARATVNLSSQRHYEIQPLYYINEDFEQLGEEYGEATLGSSSIFEDLRKRQSELEQGIGKRYICRTAKGYLNVHNEPGEFSPYNIVNQICEGDIVTSVGPPQGGWIQHDNGGWSIAKYNGFTWLEEIKE